LTQTNPKKGLIEKKAHHIDWKLLRTKLKIICDLRTNR